MSPTKKLHISTKTANLSLRGRWLGLGMLRLAAAHITQVSGSI